MKINKYNPLHWLYLGRFGLLVPLALFLRIFLYGSSEEKRILLYGHKLNSNLKGIYDYSKFNKENGVNIQFLTLDPDYFNALQAQGIDVVCATQFSTALVLAKTDCIVSDHGLHLLVLFLKFTNIKFVDVWHGIAFKGFDGNDFTVQHQYDEVWVTSKRLKQVYVDQYGFNPDSVKITGYARTDILINRNIDVSAVKRSIGIKDPNRKIILFAPTWRHDAANRNIFPFDTSENTFLGALDKLSDELSVSCIFRTHLNSADQLGSEYQHIYFAPHAAFPQTEEILLASDLLVCDWSSIAFDYLLLDRPTIFLDTPAPFAKGFSLDSSYRFGEIAGDLDEMLNILKTYVCDPGRYKDSHQALCKEIKQELYDDLADGHSSQRCIARLSRL